MNQNIRLIIVDDEPLVRERFHYGFALQENGFEIVGDAEDGEEALLLCEQLHTDIVITDIVMPRMDGLELTLRLKEKHPTIKVIILSNYQEFEFARKAVALGALGYMLKVTSWNEELLALLKQARLEIEEERSHMLDQINVRHLLHKQLPVLRKQFVLDVLNNTFANEEIAQQLIDLKLHPPTSAFSAAVIHIDDYTGLHQTYSTRDMALFKYALAQILEELSFHCCKCNILAWNDGELLLLLHWNEACIRQDEEYERLALTVFTKMSHAAIQYLPFTLSVSFSSIKPRPPGLPLSKFLHHSLKEALREAETAGKQRFYSGNNSFSMYTPDDRYASMDKESVRQLNNALESVNSAADPSYIKKEIHELLISKLEEARFHPLQVMAWLEQTAEHLFQLDPTVHKYIEKLQMVETLHDVEPFLQLLTRNRQTEL